MSFRRREEFANGTNIMPHMPLAGRSIGVSIADLSGLISDDPVIQKEAITSSWMLVIFLALFAWITYRPLRFAFLDRFWSTDD